MLIIIMSVPYGKKPLANGDVAVAFLNFDEGGTPSDITVRWSDLGFPAGSSWRVRDLWMGRNLDNANGTFTSSVNCHSATLYRLSPASSVKQH